LLFITTAFGQKVKIKDDIAIVDKTPYVKFTTITFGSDYAIKHVNSSEDEISILYLDYTDPNKVASGNPDGKVRWIEVNFVTLGLKCEVDSRGRKGFAKLLFLSNIYIDDRLNEENVNKFVSKYGTRFSDNRPDGNTTIIINN
jgi:hypothetical protein